MSDKQDQNTISNNTIQHSNVSIGDGAKQTIQAPSQPLEPSPTSVPRVFLSHSSKDDAFSARLAQDLYRALKYDVWYDKEHLSGGDVWWNRIQQELTARFVFLVVLSPDAVVSRWVNDEIAIAWEQRTSVKGKRIIPILYRECERSAELKTLHHVSFLPPKDYQEAFYELIRAINTPTSS